MNNPRVILLSPDSFIETAPFLSGFAFTPDAIISGCWGLKKYLAERGLSDGSDWEDGRFFAVLDAGAEVRVFTDPMGQDTLYYYASEDPFDNPCSDWLISNSVYEIARFASASGKPLRFLPHIAASHFISNGAAFGAQLLSNQTALEQIKVLPVGCELRISKNDQTLTAVRTRNADWVTHADGSYADLMENFILKTCSRIIGLFDSGLYDIISDLTGGHDSRAIFGMSRRSGIGDQINYFSNPALANDFASASLVADAYGFALKTEPHAEVFDTPEELYELWKQASLGVYTSVYAGSLRQDETKLRLHGGNFLSKEFGEVSASKRAKSIKRFMPNEKLAERVPRAFLQSFRQIGIASDHPWAMQLHYLNFRARFHYGRHWFATGRTPHLTPLISQHFAKAAFKLDQHAYNNLMPCMDLLLALDNQLGLIPFDSPGKSFSQTDLEMSPFWRKPLGFRIGNLKIPEVFAAISPAGFNEVAVEKLSLKGPVRKGLAENLAAAKSTKMFDSQYIDAARRELEQPGSFPHNSRKAAHIITVGTLKNFASAEETINRA